jgi:YbbR domain-containing protein
MRVVASIVHYWPLKVGAIALAALLYGGLVLSQATATLTSPVRIDIVNPPDGAIVLDNPGAVTRIQYVAPPDLGLRVDSATFLATVDLADVAPSGGSVSVDVRVEAIDDRVQVLDFEPHVIILTIDRVATKTVPIRAIVGPVPSGLEAGEPSVDATTATVSGPQSVIATITEAQAPIVIDGSGIDINQQVALVPIDDAGAAIDGLTPIDVEPALVRVRVPVFTDRRSKTVPVSPNVVGTPAAGFAVVSVEVDPPVVSVEGDANDLAGLANADTVPITVSGASSEVVQIVALALPDGVQALGTGTVQVTIRLRSVTATRNYEAGLILVGARPDRVYRLSTDRVVVTIGGSVADLDRLATTALVLTVDVTGLDVGTHVVPVSANLTTGLTLVGSSPNPIEVTVSIPAPSPAPTVGASAATP